MFLPKWGYHRPKHLIFKYSDLRVVIGKIHTHGCLTIMLNRLNTHVTVSSQLPFFIESFAFSDPQQQDLSTLESKLIDDAAKISSIFAGNPDLLLRNWRPGGNCPTSFYCTGLLFCQPDSKGSRGVWSSWGVWIRPRYDHCGTVLIHCSVLNSPI